MTAAIATAMLIGGPAAVAVANGNGGGPGPFGPNNFGLCTAYFAGSETGQQQKRQAPPFQGLEAAAEEADQSVEEWCAENAPHPSGNGNGNGNGRNG